MRWLDVLFGMAVMGGTFGAILVTVLAALGELPLWMLAFSVPALLVFAVAWYGGVVGDEGDRS
jgi:hypothetical protein